MRVKMSSKLLCQRAQCIQVLAEELDNDLRPHPRKHMIETVRDRLPDIERNREQGKARAQVGDDGVLAASALLQRNVELR